MVLHLGVKPVLEGLDLVIEDDFKKIHLFSYHNLVHEESSPVTKIVSQPQFGHHHVEHEAMN